MIVASFMWLVAPSKFYWWYNSIIFFIVGAAQMGGNLSLIIYFLVIIPPFKRVGSTLVITLISSFCAGAFGAVIGAGLLRILEIGGFHSLSLFRLFFLAAL